MIASPPRKSRGPRPLPPPPPAMERGEIGLVPGETGGERNFRMGTGGGGRRPRLFPQQKRESCRRKRNNPPNQTQPPLLHSIPKERKKKDEAAIPHQTKNDAESDERRSLAHHLSFAMSIADARGAAADWGEGMRGWWWWGRMERDKNLLLVLLLYSGAGERTEMPLIAPIRASEWGGVVL